jgi:hypothetical protein
MTMTSTRNEMETVTTGHAVDHVVLQSHHHTRLHRKKQQSQIRTTQITCPTTTTTTTTNIKAQKAEQKANQKAVQKGASWYKNMGPVGQEETTMNWLRWVAGLQQHMQQETTMVLCRCCPPIRWTCNTPAHKSKVMKEHCCTMEDAKATITKCGLN